MKGRRRTVTDVDLALLEALGHERSVVAASHRAGISRDRAVYRLARLAEAFGGPMVESERGGRAHGGTHLTPLGDRVVRGGFDTVELLGVRPLVPLPRPNQLRGIYRAGPTPHVVLDPDVRLRVAFDATEGEAVTMLLDPQSILVARGRFSSSARNVLRGIVLEIRPGTEPFGAVVVVQVGPVALRVAVADSTAHQMRLAPGSRVWLHVKATALRRVGRIPALPPHGPVTHR